MNDEHSNYPLLKGIYQKLIYKEDNYINEDERKSTAILNLQAMLNIEDID